MDWQDRIVGPKREMAPKMRGRIPCPGLCRFAGMVSFLVVSLGVFYRGIDALGLEPLDWAAPDWTGEHLALAAAAVVLGGLASVLGFGYAMRINVRSERLNDLFIVLWQFLANASVLWVLVLGAAMTFALGREAAKAAVLRFGAERAFVHVVGTGAVVGLILGAAFFVAQYTRTSFTLYFVFAVLVSLVASHRHFLAYAIEGRWWIAAGILVPILLLTLAPSMIERDRRQRRLWVEQRS